ncbi:hypothetical protein [Desulfovibrio sp. TomC]|uniref:hypothetical protein n=1 Tax=Desulfovibrio sp. TomC TaxID=1562888 RepID=UPI000574536F|nr:hypothetical protein [Desulfovibrio sp. TomC]KHK03200.1 hypothetical protein NY78_1264 [Desulfovibrio sp. TomC]
MSVQSIGQDTTNSWLSQLLASYGQQSTASQSSISSLLGLSDATSDATAATSSGSTSSAGSSVGSFNDILTALLSGDSSLSYDMSTGTLTDLSSSSQSDDMPPPPMEGSDGLKREVSETDNADGSSSRSVTMTDADGNVVGTEKTTQNADGSFSSVITMTDPNGHTTTRTITGENTEDGGFSVTSSLTDASGNVLETGQELTAADGSTSYTVTRNTPDGETMTESESYDADGNLVSSTTSSTVAAASTTGSSASSSSSSSSSESASGSSGSSDSEETTTTVTTSFSSEGLVQTTTVTDADGKIVSQTVKDIPFSADAKGQSLGASEGSKKGLSGLVDQYAANRYGASQYAAQEAALNLGSQGSGVSVEA